jgi:hypothetical protein
MPRPRLIGEYLAELSAGLTGSIVDELADGLDQTYQGYLGQGLAPEAAAQAAVAEFGEPRIIIAAFADASRGRRAARKLLAAGPTVGTCWAIALITTRAWTWPVPVAAPVAFGAALVTVIGLLSAAAIGSHYRLVRRTAAAACAGTALLDVTMACTVLVIAPALAWPVAVAVVLSAARSGFAVQNFHHILAG